MEDWLNCEMERLKTEASTIIQEYYDWSKKTQQKWKKLGVRARVCNGSLQIEWFLMERRGDKTTPISKHLPKGRGHQYSSALLKRYVDKDHQSSVLEFERRFACIREAASVLSEVRRCHRRYVNRLAKIREVASQVPLPEGRGLRGDLQARGSPSTVKRQ